MQQWVKNTTYTVSQATTIINELNCQRSIQNIIILID